MKLIGQRQAAAALPPGSWVGRGRCGSVTEWWSDTGLPLAMPAHFDSCHDPAAAGAAGVATRNRFWRIAKYSYDRPAG